MNSIKITFLLMSITLSQLSAAQVIHTRQAPTAEQKSVELMDLMKLPMSTCPDGGEKLVKDLGLVNFTTSKIYLGKTNYNDFLKITPVSASQANVTLYHCPQKNLINNQLEIVPIKEIILGDVEGRESADCDFNDIKEGEVTVKYTDGRFPAVLKFRPIFGSMNEVRSYSLFCGEGRENSTTIRTEVRTTTRTRRSSSIDGDGSQQ